MMLSPVPYAISGSDAWRVAVGRARDLTADAQLLRLEPQREDEADVLADAGVRGAAEATEHDDVAGGADFGARVDVAEHDEVTRVIEDHARAHRADDDARAGGLVSSSASGRRGERGSAPRSCVGSSNARGGVVRDARRAR